MIVVERGGPEGAVSTEQLARRMISPFVGLNSRVGFVLRGRTEPRFAVAGGQLTGVHQLLGEPEAGSYHIGGVGTTREEALIRALGESVERYCQLVSVATGSAPVRVARVAELRAEGRELVDPMGLSYFSPTQLDRDWIPFSPPVADAPYGWVEVTRVSDGHVVLVPAQLVLVGYRPHRRQGEPWLAPAVTTGTATHRTRGLAARGALLELLQIDAAMGHWYGRASAPRIRPGERLAPVLRVWERHRGRNVDLAFHHLASPDLPAITVACLLRQHEGRRPVVAVGLGCETSLAEAAYKALLEGVGVFQLAKLGLAEAARSGTRAGRVPPDQPLMDLDRNVTHYADGGDGEVLAEKFPSSSWIAEDELPQDRRLAAEDAVPFLQEGILDAGHALHERDLTPVDVASLSLITHRVWSPDLLPLAMPSAPTAGHPRFDAFGGVRHDRPHPYP